MTKYKDIKAQKSTITYDRAELEKQTGNIYESISIIAKRATQINTDIKKELKEKLEEFATHNETLEEIFENKEQIEVSKFYERLPKPQSLAIEEWQKEEVYFRNSPNTEK